jgi:hypothetical protein
LISPDRIWHTFLIYKNTVAFRSPSKEHGTTKRFGFISGGGRVFLSAAIVYHVLVSEENLSPGMVCKDGPRQPRYPLALIHPLGPWFKHLPLRLRRHLLYAQAYRKWGNFSTPLLFNEKMQWRILNDRRAILAWTCDKLASKEYAKNVSEAARIPLSIPQTLWTGTDVADLKAAAKSFPVRWVLKPNHSCGRIRIVDSSVAPIDWDDLARAVGTWVSRDEEELALGHWAYGQARHLVIAEEYVEHGPGALVDYKLVGFGGKIDHVIAIPDASSHLITTSIVLDAQGIVQNKAVLSDAQYALGSRQREELDWDRLIALAESLISPFDQMRVDLYVTPGKIWFGEMSTYQSSGLRSPAGRRLSLEVDAARGALWTLPDLSAADPRELEWRTLLKSYSNYAVRA